MFQNFKIEWLKLKRYNVFWIFSILYFLGIISVILIGYFIYLKTKDKYGASMNGMAGAIIEKFNPFRFPMIWQTSGWLSSWLLYFPGMIVMLHTVNEFNFKTHRQNIIDGWKRETFITQKIILAVVFALSVTLVNFITTIVLASLTNATISFEGAYYLIYIFIQSLAYILFAFMLAVLFRRSGAAIAIFFLYGLIFESIISNLINYFTKSGAGYFLPLQVTDVMMPIPFIDKVFYQNAPSDTWLLVGSCIYIFVYCYFAYYKFKHDDL